MLAPDGEFPDAAVEVARNTMLDRLSVRYTMAQERQVHAAVTGESAPLEADAAAATDAAELDDFLF